MLINRPLVVTAFALLALTCGCYRQRPSTVTTIVAYTDGGDPQAGLYVHAGDVLRWKTWNKDGPSYVVHFLDGNFCDPNEGDIKVTATSIGECKIKSPDNSTATTVSIRYVINPLADRTPIPASTLSSKGGGPQPTHGYGVPFRVVPCKGCNAGGLSAKTNGSFDSNLATKNPSVETPPQPLHDGSHVSISCSANGELQLEPSDPLAIGQTIHWTRYGNPNGWSISFPGNSSPCEGVTSTTPIVADGAGDGSCKIATTATSGPYPYTVTAPGCTSGPSVSGTITVK
jgi:hypothetical protein